VHALVERHVGADAGRALDRDELRVEPAGGGAQVVVHPLGGQPRGLRLELGAHLGDVDDVVGLDLGDVRARPRADLDEALEREALDGLAQRRAPEAEVAHQRVLAQGGAGGQAQGDDLVAQAGVGAVGDQAVGGRVGADGLTGHDGG
jgi:hypothetical protein